MIYGSDFIFWLYKVEYKKWAPIFSTTITTIDDTIYYDTLFYDVVRCNKNDKILETVTLDETVLNICK